jgi:hypothetical protein
MEKIKYPVKSKAKPRKIQIYSGKITNGSIQVKTFRASF